MTTEERLTQAITEIGGAAALLDLPEQVKRVLMHNYDLETKTKMLELVRDALKSGAIDALKAKEQRRF